MAATDDRFGMDRSPRSSNRLGKPYGEFPWGMKQERGPAIAETAPSRPRRTDVSAIYDRGVESYDSLWSPVILPAAESLIPLLELTARSVVVDVGAGTGALLGAIRSAAPTAHAVALDASNEMLRVAHHRGALAVQADALALPLPQATADAVILAYVLFHLADPPLAVTEAARVLRPSGRVGTVTWAWERGARAQALWDEVLADAGVPPAPRRSLDAGLDRPDAIEGLLRTAGLQPQRVWLQRLRCAWDKTSFWERSIGAGVNRVRLSLVDSATHSEVLSRLRRGLNDLAPEDFIWEGEVICAVAKKTMAT